MVIIQYRVIFSVVMRKMLVQTLRIVVVRIILQRVFSKGQWRFSVDLVVQKGRVSVIFRFVRVRLKIKVSEGIRRVQLFSIYSTVKFFSKSIVFISSQVRVIIIFRVGNLIGIVVLLVFSTLFLEVLFRNVGSGVEVLGVGIVGYLKLVVLGRGVSKCLLDWQGYLQFLVGIFRFECFFQGFKLLGVLVYVYILEGGVWMG